MSRSPISYEDLREQNREGLNPDTNTITSREEHSLERVNQLLPEAGEKPDLYSLISVHDFEDVARNALAPKTWAFYSSAATDLVSHQANLMCHRKLLLRPRVLRDVRKVKTKRKILGHESSIPVFFSPAAMAKLAHSEGEVAVARACGNQGIVQIVCQDFGLSLLP